MDDDARRAFLRRSTRWTAALVGVWAGIAWLVSGREMALGVTLGALVGWANLVLLDRALYAVMRDPAAHRPVGARKWSLPLAFLVKWPLVLLALAVVLWYMPARPEGVAMGVLVSLAAAAMAAVTRRKPKAGP
jgi:hypothetical protein